MDRYQNNAFRVLGLLPGASLSEIKQRADELDIEVKLGVSHAYKYDFLFLGPIDRSYENIIGAVERLENPAAKLREEMLYFWIDDEEDKKGLELLCEGNVKQAILLWESQFIWGTDCMSSSVNLAILTHARVIANELNGTFEDEHWDDWESSLKTYIKLNQSNVYWNRIEDKLEQYQDKRTKGIDLEKLKSDQLNDIARANSEFILKYLKSGDDKLVKEHVKLLDVFDDGTIKYNVEFIAQAYQEEVLIAFKQLEFWYSHYAEIVSSQELISVTNNFINGIRFYIIKMRIVDTKNLSSFSTVRDKLAKLLREIAVTLHNKNECRHAYKIMQYSYSLICSEYLKNKYQDDVRILKDASDIATKWGANEDSLAEENNRSHCPKCGSTMILGRCVECIKSEEVINEEHHLSILPQNPFDKIAENTQIAKEWLINFYEEFQQKRSAKELVAVAKNYMLGIEAIIDTDVLEESGKLDFDESKISILDQAARVIREYTKAIITENPGSHYEIVEDLYACACSIAQSDVLKAELEEDINKFDEIRNISSPEQNEPVQKDGSLWVPILVIVTFFVVLIGIPFCFDEKPNNTYENSLSVPSKEQSSSGSLLKQRMGVKKLNIENREKALTKLEKRIKRLKTELTDIAAMYPDGAPGYVVDDYDTKRTLHNRLITKYNKQEAGYKKEIAAYNELVKEYNRTIK